MRELHLHLFQIKRPWVASTALPTFAAAPTMLPQQYN